MPTKRSPKPTPQQLIKLIDNLVSNLNSLRLEEVVSLMNGGQRLVSACIQQLDDAMRSAANAANEISTQANNLKQKAVKPQSGPSNQNGVQSIMGMNPMYNQQVQSQQQLIQAPPQNHHPLPPFSAPTQTQDGQIRIEMPIIGHWDGQEDDGLIGHAVNSNSNYSNQSNLPQPPNLDQESQRLGLELDNKLSMAFRPTQDANGNE